MGESYSRSAAIREDLVAEERGRETRGDLGYSDASIIRIEKHRRDAGATVQGVLQPRLPGNLRCDIREHFVRDREGHLLTAGVSRRVRLEAAKHGLCQASEPKFVV